MARYLQVSGGIAESIAAGMLVAGDELPSIRDAARRYDTTATTIGRAYRHLADAGVIEVTGRRRSRVAAGGDIAARRMLGGHPATCGTAPARTTARSPVPCCAAASPRSSIYGAASRAC
ncbi:MAG: GntR family transcriptional regulator [Streptosporangiaceae bacterium]